MVNMPESVLSLSNKMKSIVVPEGRSGRAITIDVSEIYNSLERIPEISRATAMTAPELMATFNMAMVQTSRLIGIIDQQKVVAESAYREEKSVALLTRADSILAQYNQKSTADSREAAVTGDPTVKERRERLGQLEVMSEMFHNTYHDLRDALYSAKKICDLFMKLPTDNTAG